MPGRELERWGLLARKPDSRANGLASMRNRPGQWALVPGPPDVLGQATLESSRSCDAFKGVACRYT